MTGLIIATHGVLAPAAIELVEMFTGPQENVETVGFQMGDSLEALLGAFGIALGRLKACEEILIMTDLKGGSPCNAATVMMTQNTNIRVIAGFSIPALVQFLEDRRNGLPLAESIGTVIEVGKCSLCEIKIDEQN
jgi:mannose/fructose/sorbose-specific phosphotransferase system IIA component